MNILLLLGVAVAAMLIYQWMVRRSTITEATPSPASPLTDNGDEQSSPDADAFMGALKYGREVAVAGESHDNPDGISRTSIIAQLNPRDMVLLEREPNNTHDGNAIIVKSLKGVIGYVNKDDAAEIAPWLDRGERVVAYIASIAGGPDEGKEYYGVWLRVVSIEQLPAWIEARDKHRAVR